MAKTKKVMTLTRMEKKNIKRLGRLSANRGRDLCDCNGGICDSICRENHTNERTGAIECISVYRIDESQFRKNRKDSRKDGRSTPTDKETSRSKYNKKSRKHKDED